VVVNVAQEGKARELAKVESDPSGIASRMRLVPGRPPGGLGPASSRQSGGGGDAGSRGRPSSCCCSSRTCARRRRRRSLLRPTTSSSMVSVMTPLLLLLLTSGSPGRGSVRRMAVRRLHGVVRRSGCGGGCRSGRWPAAVLELLLVAHHAMIFFLFGDDDSERETTAQVSYPNKGRIQTINRIPARGADGRYPCLA
jgi:hypothetical protein